MWREAEVWARPRHRPRPGTRRVGRLARLRDAGGSGGRTRSPSTSSSRPSGARRTSPGSWPRTCATRSRGLPGRAGSTITLARPSRCGKDQCRGQCRAELRGRPRRGGRRRSLRAPRHLQAQGLSRANGDLDRDAPRGGAERCRGPVAQGRRSSGFCREPKSRDLTPSRPPPFQGEGAQVVPTEQNRHRQKDRQRSPPHCPLPAASRRMGGGRSRPRRARRPLSRTSHAVYGGSSGPDGPRLPHRRRRGHPGGRARRLPPRHQDDAARRRGERRDVPGAAPGAAEFGSGPVGAVRPRRSQFDQCRPVDPHVTCRHATEGRRPAARCAGRAPSPTPRAPASSGR